MPILLFADELRELESLGRPAEVARQIVREHLVRRRVVRLRAQVATKVETSE